MFISYRREDGKKYALEIKRCLEKEFGAGSVFMDTSEIEPGVEVMDRLMQELSDCAIVIVVIGPKWLKILNERRAKRKFDYVDLEVGRALKEAELVVPILLGNAERPSRDSLPVKLKDLSNRNAVTFDVPSRAGLSQLIVSVRKRDDPVVQFNLEARTNWFKRQKIVQKTGRDQSRIARKLASVAKVSCLNEGAELYSEEGPSHRKFLFFVFDGCIRLTDKGDLDFIAEQHEMMGEFPCCLEE
jgi:hypothetical protein